MMLQLLSHRIYARSALSWKSISVSRFIAVTPKVSPPTIFRQLKNEFHSSRHILNRDLGPVQKIDQRKIRSENIYTIPNMMTVTRILCTPFIGHYIVCGQPVYAMSVFVFSCITDFIDGYIARRFNMKTVIGSIIDPMADKLLMTICTLALSYTSTMPTYVGVLIIGRDLMLAGMAVYYRYISLSPPKTFKRYFDITSPTVSVHPNMISKINTGLQMLYIGSLILNSGMGYFIDSRAEAEITLFLQGLEYLVATTTLISGCSYVFSKNAIKFIK
ncbi:Piso0_000513 [Millerozyma farinosa CBS 7064]|uniref:Piso0_000513 protein n=1 Tax=Pichia sorbitophila (strain ATCC MYA-4447 / BCRC 22081 / CBS 7064 / NBRC 10061 / NRRL Y-12695) TaxID=559304 RepID=G8YU70_PICSO|nr:Piso0_000513 [Millerozyma farinosa CBS 7064]CCE73471.1 Piso0_000513 [Millerozyma farinosa CBS 7064]